jgi:phage FluMu protein Com
MLQFRCPQCKKLLFKYELIGSLKLETVCSRCSKTVTLEIKGSDSSGKKQKR